MEKVDIIGTGLTSVLYDWSRQTDKWSVGASSGIYKDKINLYFCMHPGETVKGQPCLTFDDFPLEGIQKMYKSDFFTCSIAYMIAYAMYEGIGEINLYGVDLEHDSEYVHQRPSVIHWVTKAREQEIIVNISTPLDQPFLLYGIDEDRRRGFIEYLQMRVNAYNARAHLAENQDQKNQFLGAAFATQKIITQLKG